MDAVNFKQLTDAGLTVDPTGTVTNAFVAYTDKTLSSVALGRYERYADQQPCRRLSHMDAVNVKQLKDAGRDRRFNRHRDERIRRLRRHDAKIRSR